MQVWHWPDHELQYCRTGTGVVFKEKSSEFSVLRTLRNLWMS
jgi:hypothetical protein